MAPAWEEEWLDAAAVDRIELAEARRRASRFVLALAPPAAIAALLPAIFPLTPGYSTHDTLAMVAAAAVSAGVAVGIVPAVAAVAQTLSRRRWTVGGFVLPTVALLSAGAAAIHFAVAKMHFEEYTLFGVFFVLSGIAQLGWALWVLVRPSRALFVLGAIGNLLIAALWAADRVWGLPIGPDHWKPETIGFGDTIASAFEILLAAGCIALLMRGPRRRPVSRGTAAALAVPVIVLTALSLLSAMGVGSSFLTPSA